MTKHQRLLAAIDLLENALPHVDKNDFNRIKAFLNDYYETLTKRPSGVQLDPHLTKQYEKAKRYVSSGNSIAVACSKAGITRDQWYRRKNVDVHGKCRPNKRDY